MVDYEWLILVGRYSIANLWSNLEYLIFDIVNVWNREFTTLVSHMDLGLLEIKRNSLEIEMKQHMESFELRDLFSMVLNLDSSRDLIRVVVNFD